MSSATQNCEFCSSPAHVWFNCPKKPDGWKPDRLKNAAAGSQARPADAKALEGKTLKSGGSIPPVAPVQVTPRFKSGKPSPKNSEPTPVTPADPPRSAAASRKAAGRASARKPSGEADAPRRKAGRTATPSPVLPATHSRAKATMTEPPSAPLRAPAEGVVSRPSRRGGTPAPQSEPDAAVLPGQLSVAEAAASPQRAAASAPTLLAEAERAAAHLAPDVTTRGTPRKRAPKGTFDRKANQRERAKKRRAAERAAREATTS